MRRVSHTTPCPPTLPSVVPSVVAANAARYAGDEHVRFAEADLSAVSLPPGGADLILCRDALQHIPLLDAIDVLQNFARARPRVLAVGSYLDGGVVAAGAPDDAPRPPERNREIPAGEYYHINLLAPPFNMSEPLDILDENTPVKDARERKFLLVYAGDYLAELDFDAMRRAAVDGFGAKLATGDKAKHRALAVALRAAPEGMGD